MLSVEEVDRARSNHGPRAVQSRRVQWPLELFFRAKHVADSKKHMHVAALVGVPPNTANKWLLSQHLPTFENAIKILRAYPDVLEPLHLTMKLSVPQIQSLVAAARRDA